MQSKLSPLPPLRQKPLRELLDSDAFLTLIEVLESSAYDQEVECVNSRITALDNPNYEIKAKEAAQRASEFHRTVKLLRSLREDRKPNMIFSSTPTPTATAPQPKG